MSVCVAELTDQRLLSCGQGIFDAAANYQRAQAICLVELQKRCKLDQLRDDAIREVVDGDESAGTASDGRQRRMADKLSLLLVQSNQLGHDSAEGDVRQEAAVPLAMNVTGGDSKREPTSRHVAVKTERKPGGAKVKTKTGAKKNTKLLPRLQTRGSNQHDLKNAVILAQRSSDSRGSSAPQVRRDIAKSPENRREELGLPGSRGERANRSSHGLPKTDVSGLGGGDRRDDTLAHHPHIVQVLQHMASGGFGPSRPTTSLPGGFTVLGSDLDDTRPKAAKEHWMQRPKAYQVIAGRMIAALRKGSERMRWDSLSHFTNTDGSSVLVLSDKLLERLSATAAVTIRRGGVSSASHTTSSREETAEKRKRTDQLYASVQEEIRARLHREKKRSLTSSAKSSRSKGSGQVPEADAGVDGLDSGGGGGVWASTLTSVSGGSDPYHNSGEVVLPHLTTSSKTSQANGTTSSLGASASVPMLGAKPKRFDALAAGVQATPSSTKPVLATSSVSQLLMRLSLSLSSPGLPDAASAMAGQGRRSDAGHHSLVDKKLRASHTRQRRKESLIGVSVPADYNTIGHHSNARMEERRYSAQTWMWHHPSVQGTNGPAPVTEASNEDDDGDDDGGDTLGYALAGGEADDGDDNTEGLENDRVDDNDTDDTSSVAYSFYALESARSSHSNASAITYNGSRKRKIVAVKKRHGKLLHQVSSSSLHHSHASGQTAGSLAMQARLEEIWRVLEFPFSHKLLMLEKYAELQDADVFQCSLASWEKVAEVVLVRERMKTALKDFDKHGEVKPSSRLTGPEWMFVRSLQIETPGEGGVGQALSSQELVTWVRGHILSAGPLLLSLTPPCLSAFC